MYLFQQQLNIPTMYQHKYFDLKHKQRLSVIKENVQSRLSIELMNVFTWHRPTLKFLSIEMLPKLSEHGTNFKQSS